MKKEIVSPSNSPQPGGRIRGRCRTLAAVAAAFTFIACVSSSALAQKCEIVEFSDNGAYPQTVYVYASTATPGATIFATMGNYYIPADPTHNGGTPTGSTFICGGTFAVFYGQHKWFKAIAYKAGMQDSDMTIYEVDNSGN